MTRPDDDPITWRDLREAMNLTVEFAMSSTLLTASAFAALREGKSELEIPEELAEIARRIEAKYRLEDL